MHAKTKLTLGVKTRSAVGKTDTRELRAGNLIPAVLYGHGTETKHVRLNPQEFEKMYRQAGESTLIDLQVDEQPPVPVLVSELQRNPLTREITHVDFHQVRMDEKIYAEVKLHFVGTAPAEKEIGGILVTNLDSVEIECLPGDLIDELEVDLSTLKNFHDVIHVSDLNDSDAIKITNGPDEVVALIQEPRTEADVEASSTVELVAEVVAPAEDAEVGTPEKTEDGKS
jgi:large subunit ribosomal protein L25